jgi:integrase/recombinase XerD
MRNEIRPTSPLRHGSQQGSLSAKLSRVLRLYRDDLVARYSARTVPSFLSSVRFFLGWLEGRGVELLEARPQDLLAYQGELLTLSSRRGKPYALATQHAFLTALKNFYRFLFRRGFVLADPAASLHLPRKDKRLPRVILSRREVLRLLDSVRERSAAGLRDRAILETLYATGIRASELGNLTPYDVDAEGRLLRVVLGKGAKDRVVPLTDKALQAIERYLEQARPKLVRGKTAHLFLQARGGKLRRSELARLVAERARHAGIRKHVTPHTLRHSVATHLLQGGADIRHIQALLGHACLSTTQIYTRVEMQDLRRVIRRAHPRGR